MPFSFFRLFLVALLCHQPARPLLRSYIVSSKALLSQLVANKNEITTGVPIRRRVHAAADSAYMFTKTPFVASGMSYSSLLVHYLSQNVKPKYGLCLNVISKIVEHEGPDAAIRTSESLKYNTSAEGFHMANKALLSALVLQRHLEAASSQLRRLLLDQSEHRQVDATVVADLLQLHMAVDGDHETTKVRRKYKKRAVEASSLYSDVIGTQLLCSEEFPQLHGVGTGIGTDEGYGDPMIESMSGSAVNRIHEYGARAFAASREWEQAVLAVGRIEEKHLSSPQMVSFCTQLLDRLVALNVPSATQQFTELSAASVEQMSNTPDDVDVSTDSDSDSDIGCDGSAALAFALSLPLATMPTDSPLLHASLLVMSACPSNVEAVIALLQGTTSRQLHTDTDTVKGTDIDIVAERTSQTARALLPKEVSLKLTKQLFIGGCSVENLVLAMRVLWGDEVLQNSREDTGLEAKYSSAITDSYYETSDTVCALSQMAEDAVHCVLSAACSLRDLQGGEEDEVQRKRASISKRSVEEIPLKILRALPPQPPPAFTPSAASHDSMETRNSVRIDGDTLNTLRLIPIPVPLLRPVSLSRAISPSLHCLCIALRLSGHKDLIGTLIQAIEDAYPNTYPHTYPKPYPEPTQQRDLGPGPGPTDKNSDFYSDTERVIVPRRGDSDVARDAVWSLSTELMVEALDLTGDVDKDGYIEPLAVYREATLRIRNDQMVLPSILSALFRDATVSCRAVQHSRAGTVLGSGAVVGAGTVDAAPAEAVTAPITAPGTGMEMGAGMGMGTGTGTDAGVTAAAKVLWDAMVQKGLPVCYESGPVLSSALLFMFTLGDNPREIGGDRDRDRVQRSETGEEGKLTRALGEEGWNLVPGSSHPSLGMKACLDSVAIAVAAPSGGARTHEVRTLDRIIEDTFSLLFGMRASMLDSSELEDTPRAVLRLLFQERGESSDGREGAGAGGMQVGLEGLILGAVLSLGGPSCGPGSSSLREGGSEGCTYRYSSLLRLSLYLSTVPDALLQTLIPALLRRGREWPKVVLKALSHLYSTSRIQGPRSTYGPAESASSAPPAPTVASAVSVTHGKSSLVRIVLEAFDQLLIEELSVPVAEAVPASVHQMDATSTGAPPPTPAPLPVPADLPSPHTSSLAAALQRLTTNPAMTLTPGRHVSSSATLGAAIDLCCSTQHPEGVVEQEKGRQGTKRKRKSTKGEEEVKVEGETEMVRTYAQCKLYYSIGWLAAESAAKSLLDSDQRHLGVSLNQLSFALLKAAQRLNRPSAEAMQIVRHKIEFFATKMTASFVSESESASLPADARMGEKAVEDSATDGLAFTRVAAAAVTYRETRLLSSIATADSGGREQLMCFWSSVMTAHPSLMGYSTALFEVLDSHMAAGNCTGTIAWAGVALTGGMLPPMRVKELLIRYSDTTSLHCLPTLLPLLSKLSTSQSDLEFEDGLSTYDTPVLYRRGGVSDLYLPLPMSVLRSLSVTLLEQHRLGDARVLLKCVHPFQWPYDELLLALATASSITGANIDSVGEKGSEGRKRECSAVLRRREELSLSLALNPISSSTAKALLAMQADTSASEKGEKEKGTGNSESEKSFRILVARAVKSGGQDGAMRSASASAVLGGDNNNGRSFSSISSNALSEGDVRSGLLALLTLYSLTDSSNATQEISAQPQDHPADSASAMTDSSSSVGDDWDLDRGAESAAVPAPSASKWVDPESPENLAKFLLDVENLGSRSTQSGYSESAIDSPVGSSSEPGAVGGGAGGGSKEGAVAERRVSNVGLRVSGSKKSWKRSSTFGSSFDKSVRGSSSIPPFSYPYPSTSLSVTPTPTPSAASTVLPAVEVSSTEAGVDEIVCRELARSLLAAVTSQISSLEGLDTHQEAGTGAGVHSTEGVEVSRFGGLSDRDLDKQKRLIRAADEKQYQGICGAVAELFSLSNQQQADRLFRTFSDTPTLCARLLHLCALRSDPGPAALVLEQMAVQHTISREIAVMWQSIRSIMANSTSTRDRRDDHRDRDRDRDRHTYRHTDGLSHPGPHCSSEVWGDVKRIFSSVRPSVLHGLRVTPEGEGEGDGSTPPSPSTSTPGSREELSEILQLGILSHLMCLHESKDTAQTRRGDTQSDDSDVDAAEVEVEVEDSTEEHWMKAGEREKQKTRFAAKQQFSSAERAIALSSSRALALELVQQFPSLGLTLSDAFGSQLICAFLTLSDDVDASLSILNILLRAGGHASDEACELLAKRLLSRRRQAMARAICRLMHSRGRLCDISFYAFLFASILSPGPSDRGALDPYPLPPRGLGEQDGREREIERMRVRGEEVSREIDSESESESDRAMSTGVIALGGGADIAFPVPAAVPAPAVTEALILLDEIMQGVITSMKARPNGTGTADSASESSSEIKFLKIASNLIDILSRLGYGDQGLRSVYGSIERMKRLWTA